MDIRNVTYKMILLLWSVFITIVPIVAIPSTSMFSWLADISLRVDTIWHLHLYVWVSTIFYIICGRSDIVVIKALFLILI